MADYYTQFSETLSLKGKQAKAWVDKYLDQFDEDYIEEGNSNYDNIVDLVKLYGLDPAYPYLDFNLQLHDDSKGSPSLWIYADESGNPDQVAIFVQAYLKKFDPEGSFSMSWAATCSKLRTDGFSGGGIFVTAEKIEHMYTEDWLDKKRKAFERKLKKAKLAKSL